MTLGALEHNHTRGLGPSGFGENRSRGGTESEEARLAKAIGEFMSGKILCPRKCVDGQALSTFGDFENSLFCPHCELEVDIVVKNV